MKRLFIIFSLLALFSCSKEEVFKMDSSPLVKSMNTLSADLIDSTSVTREAVLNLVDSLYSSVNTNIWVSNAPLGASDTLICNRIMEAFSPDYVSWLVIVDKHPLANWGHECTYVFVNARTMETEELIFDWLPIYVDITCEKTYVHEN